MSNLVKASTKANNGQKKGIQYLHEGSNSFIAQQIKIWYEAFKLEAEDAHKKDPSVFFHHKYILQKAIWKAKDEWKKEKNNIFSLLQSEIPCSESAAEGSSGELNSIFDAILNDPGFESEIQCDWVRPTCQIKEYIDNENFNSLVSNLFDWSAKSMGEELCLNPDTCEVRDADLLFCQYLSLHIISSELDGDLDEDNLDMIKFFLKDLCNILPKSEELDSQIKKARFLGIKINPKGNASTVFTRLEKKLKTVLYYFLTEEFDYKASFSIFKNFELAQEERKRKVR